MSSSAVWPVDLANVLMVYRDQGKLAFEGSLFSPDGRADFPKLAAVQEQWRTLRTLITHNGCTVQLRIALLAADCAKADVRGFYAAHPEATTFVFQSEERPRDALSR